MRTRIQTVATWTLLVILLLMWLMILGGCSHTTPDSFGSGTGGSLQANIETAQQGITVLRKAATDQWERNFVEVIDTALTKAHAQAIDLTERCSKAEQSLVEMDDWWVGPKTIRTRNRIVAVGGGYVLLVAALLTWGSGFWLGLGKFLYQPLGWLLKLLVWLLALPFRKKGGK